MSNSSNRSSPTKQKKILGTLNLSNNKKIETARKKNKSMIHQMKFSNKKLGSFFLETPSKKSKKAVFIETPTISSTIIPTVKKIKMAEVTFGGTDLKALI